MALGRPITLSTNVASKTLSITATAGQTAFTPTGGYRVNQLAVYRNGTRLVNGRDYTATDGSLVTLLSGATVDDIIDFQIFDSFNIADALNANGNQDLDGNLTINGICSATSFSGTGIGTGNVSTSDLFVVGVSTLSDTVSLPDDKSITLGGDDDLEIHHAGGGNSYIKNNTGELEIRSDTTQIVNKNNSQTIAEFTTGASVGITSVGILTAHSSVTVGTAVTINSTGIDAVSGVITASSFVGNVTGNASGTAGGLTGTPDITVRNITGVAATFTGVLTYEDVTNVDSVGLITARSGIEFGASGVGGTITSVGNAEFAGIATVGGDLSIAEKIIHTGDTNTFISFPTADTVSVETGGSERTRVDSSGRFLIGTNSARSAGGVTAQSQVEGTSFATASLNLISNAGTSAGNVAHLTLAKSRGSSDGSSTIVADGDYLGTIQFVGADGVDLANVAAHIQAQVDGTPGADDMPGALYFGTTADGGTAPTNRLKITRDGGFQFSNGLFDERVKITAGKLSGNTNIDLENGMVHYFTTQETTTATPNIRINSSTTLQTAMDTGDVCTVTLITTAAAAGYSANLTIDGNAVTEEWVGGSAPSEGGSDGLDIYTYTIICIGTGTGDSGFKVIANLTNASN